MREAAALLSETRSLDGLVALLQTSGLGSDVAFLDASEREHIGAQPVERAALVGSGSNALRVLVVELEGDTTIREQIPRIARRVSSRAPHVLWLVAARERSGRCGIVGWIPESLGQRLASFIWEPEHVTDSDAETLCALSASRSDESELFHLRCVELLGRDSLTRRFYRALEHQVGALAADLPDRVDRDDARTIALLFASRLLFLSFLEAKGWLDAQRDFLSAQYDTCMRSGGRFHQRVLLPLFFGTLNTPARQRSVAARVFGKVPFLNGGLFARTPTERRAGRFAFRDETCGRLFDHVFRRYRFVAREDSATWSEASIDPEMLGRAFESLMRGADRKAGGVFYTPHELVARVTNGGLDAVLHAPTLEAVSNVRLLDPACGSGAFLVYALERLAERRQTLGDARSVADIRRDVLARSIFGVDRHPTATWLCELRLWLSVVIESAETDPQRVAPLPNLDRNIRVGDSLTGSGFTRGTVLIPGCAALGALRARYINATGKRKHMLARMLDRAERQRQLSQLERDISAAVHARREHILALRARDLFGGRRHPTPEERRHLRRIRDSLRALRRERRRIADGGALSFSFAVGFADVQARGGFDVVVGNPPWVRIHRIPASLRATLRETYHVFRSARWTAGAESSGTAPGFASQVDLAALFVERSQELLRDGGALSFLLPVKLWHSLAGGGVRDFLRTRTRLLRVEDLSESRHSFDAAVYPSLVVARSGDDGTDVVIARESRQGRCEWSTSGRELAIDETPGAPWLLLSPSERSAFHKLNTAGIPLARSKFGAPRLGVKCGCNAAFLVRVVSSANGLAVIRDANGESGTIEESVLRPALRGDEVTPWTRRTCDESIIWTHDEEGAPLARLPERTRIWLRQRYSDLAHRSDSGRSRRWWSLFRTAAADARNARVVWADFGKRPRALVLPAGDPAVPLNTCYVVRVPNEGDASALATLLNSLLTAAWLNAIAEPARGGYRRYLGWTVGLLPMPRSWERAREILVAAQGCDDRTVLEATLAAYRLNESDVAALLCTS